MLAELKFVQGSVAKKDFLPALTHFRIEKGTVRGYNGTLALSSPIPLDLTCTPRADALVRAIANCDETVSLSLTQAGRLAVRSGGFKAFIDCVAGETPHVEPEGKPLEINGVELLNALKALQPFVSDDASRPWSNGVLLRGCSAYATNNVVLVEYWIGTEFPLLNIPRAAVKELVRINEAPIGAQADATSITFHFAGLQVIKPFADKIGRVLFQHGRMTTHEQDNEGAVFETDGSLPDGVYAIEMIALLEGVAKTADWSLYPKPAMFFGDRLRGAVIGMRK